MSSATLAIAASPSCRSPRSRSPARCSACCRWGRRSGPGSAPRRCVPGQGALGPRSSRESGAEFLRLPAVTGGYLWGSSRPPPWSGPRRAHVGPNGPKLDRRDVPGRGRAVRDRDPVLMQALDVTLGKALELGLAPFVVGDTIKLLAAAGLLPLAWRVVRGGPSAGRRSARSARASRTGARPRRSEPSPNATASPSSTWWLRPASTSRR